MAVVVAYGGGSGDTVNACDAEMLVAYVVVFAKTAK
jgi:hypothetical protein